MKPQKIASLTASLDTLCISRADYDEAPPTRECAGFPNEIVIMCFGYMSVRELSAMRLVCLNWKSIIRALSKKELIHKMSELATAHRDASIKYDAKQVDTGPQLVHYLTFMRQVSHLFSNLWKISIRELSEAIWYNTPPAELQTVCECLCLLSVNQLPALPDASSLSTPPSTPVLINIQNRLSWRTIKKMMTHSEFKSWILNLKSNCESIPSANIKRVEEIIMNDQSITYPRLREVSNLGYRLLIFVAAVLQYSNLYWALEVDRIAEIDASLALTNVSILSMSVDFLAADLSLGSDAD